MNYISKNFEKQSCVYFYKDELDQFIPCRKDKGKMLFYFNGSEMKSFVEEGIVKNPITKEWFATYEEFLVFLINNL